jgi:hypothetical protein
VLAVYDVRLELPDGFVDGLLERRQVCFKLPVVKVEECHRAARVRGETGEIERQRALYRLVVRKEHGVYADSGDFAELRRVFRHDDADLMPFFHQVDRDVPSVRPASGAYEREMVDHQYFHLKRSFLSMNSLHASITCSYSLM